MREALTVATLLDQLGFDHREDVDDAIRWALVELSIRRQPPLLQVCITPPPSDQECIREFLAAAGVGPIMTVDRGDPIFIAGQADLQVQLRVAEEQVARLERERDAARAARDASALPCEFTTDVLSGDICPMLRAVALPTHRPHLPEDADRLQVETRIAELIAERTVIFARRSPLDSRVLQIHEELQPLRERRDHLRIQAGEFDWRTAVKDLASDDRSSRVMHRHAEEKIRQFDMHLSGHWSDTLEADVCMKVEQTDESELANLAGLRFFTHLLTPHENGRVWFSLFEHTLSANGGYRLEVTPASGESILFRRGWEQMRFASLEAAVKYIRAHHWYGDLSDSDQ